MPSQGPYSPATIVNDASNGSALAWTNPGNAASSNNAYATRAGTGAVTQYLKATDFRDADGQPFSIPDGAAIDGIKAEMEGFSSNPFDFSAPTMRLVKGGAILNTNPGGPSPSTWPSADAYRTWGGEADLWGVAWTPEDINAPGFGAALFTATSAFAAYSVDHFRITVYFTPVTAENVRLRSASMRIAKAAGTPRIAIATATARIPKATFTLRPSNQ